MKRVPNWEKELLSVVESYEGAAWQYGRTDCAHFAGDCVLAITGQDPLGRFRGNYTNRLEAWSRLRVRKFKNLSDATAAALEALGCKEGEPACSMPGDVGITADGVLCVRFVCGFIARADDGTFKKVSPVRSWCVAWPGAD